MKLEIMYFGKLRQLNGGVAKELFDINDGLTLAGLLDVLRERFGTEFSKGLSEIRDLRILLNGREYQLLGGMSAALKDGDTVEIVNFVGGG